MDKRTLFLSQELRHALMFVAEFARDAVNGVPNVLRFTPMCHVCEKSFNSIYKNSHSPYMFMVIKSWLEEDVDCVKFTCLACKRYPAQDVIQLYPSFSLVNLKKLMYNGTLKKFVFPFKQPSKKKCRRIGVEMADLALILTEVVNAKLGNEEFESISLYETEGEVLVASDSLYHLRVDWGSNLTFSVPSQFSRELTSKAGAHYLEIISREYEEYQPFYVYFHHSLEQKTCKACKNKVCAVSKKKASPVLFCENCGFTDPKYWSSSQEIYPFWLDRYNCKRAYWKCRKKVNVMLYDVDVSL